MSLRLFLRHGKARTAAWGDYAGGVKKETSNG